MKGNDTIFYKLTAVSAFATAVTTFLLWVLPQLYESPSDFEGSVLLSTNTSYLLKQWINFLHIPLAIVAYFGLAYKLRKRELPIVSLGLIWFIIWGIIEMTGVATIIFSVNGTWRANYGLADSIQKVALQSNIDAFYSVWDSMFFVLLVAFLLATTLYGWATFNGQGIEKILSYLFFLATPLTILIILSGYWNVNWAGTIVTWTYPILQPVSRFVLGLFLWQNLNNTNGKTGD